MAKILSLIKLLGLSTATVITAFTVPTNTNVRRRQCSSTNLHATKEATFGMGCFWKPSEELLKVDGVIDTTVGYTGNPTATQIPDYDKVCFSRDWVEGVRVQYDDSKVSYEQLLEAFFETQEPKVGGSRQYASIIFAHDNEQQSIAQKWLQEGTAIDRVREKDGCPISITTIEPLSTFYKAEGYHQQYWQKFRPRVAAIVALIFINTGIFDKYISDPTLVSTLHSAVSFGFQAIAVYVLAERFILDKKVEALE